jgi:hypothetical protein
MRESKDAVDQLHATAFALRIQRRSYVSLMARKTRPISIFSHAEHVIREHRDLMHVPGLLGPQSLRDFAMTGFDGKSHRRIDMDLRRCRC